METSSWLSIMYFQTRSLIGMPWKIECPHLLQSLVEHFLGLQVCVLFQNSVRPPLSHGAQGDGIYPTKHLVRKYAHGTSTCFSWSSYLVRSLSFFPSLSLSLSPSLSVCVCVCVSLNRTEVCVKAKGLGSKRSQTFTYLFNLKSFPRTCSFLPLLIL